MLSLCVLAGLAAAALASAPGQQALPGPPPSSPPPAATAAPPAPVTQSKPGNPQPAKPAPDAASPQPATPAVLESEALLKLATDLKAEVDKTTQDTLSLAVVRKAAELERVAHAVREKAKAAAAANRGGGS
jgi:hypothetical protein